MTTPSIYEQAMGSGFSQLASAIQRFHGLTGRHKLHGWVSTEAPATLLGKLLAMLLGAPTKTGKGPIKFVLDAQGAKEVWTRHFPFKTMASTLSEEGGRIVERLGVARLSFHLAASEGMLVLRLQDMRFLGLPCPRCLMPAVLAEETGGENKLHFKVMASLPFIGRVVSYNGYLNVPDEATR